MSDKLINRIVGFDVARSLAIFGMIIVNFALVTNANSGNKVLLWLTRGC